MDQTPTVPSKRTRRTMDDFAQACIDVNRYNPTAAQGKRRIIKTCDMLFFSLSGWREIFDRWAIVPTTDTDFCPTLATTGPHLFFNVDFTASLSNSELKEIIIHEAGHVALSHPTMDWKSLGCNFLEANAGADCAIHGLFTNLFNYLKNGKYWFPGYGHVAHFPTNKSTEVYIKMIMDEDLVNKQQEQSQQPESVGQASQNDSGFEIDGGDSDSDNEDFQDCDKGDNEDSEQGDNEAGRPGSGCGTGDAEPAERMDANDSAGFITMEDETEAEWIESQVPVMQDFNELGYGDLKTGARIGGKDESTSDLCDSLRAILDTAVTAQQSYRKPRRRGQMSDMIMPCNKSLELGSVAFLVDTSYSMNDSQILSGINRVVDILDDYPHTQVSIFQCAFNLDVANYTVINPGERFTADEINRTTTGGTDLTSALVGIDELCQPSVIVVWSDMEWSYKRTIEPGCPVLWARVQAGSYRPIEYPFGESINVSYKDQTEER